MARQKSHPLLKQEKFNISGRLPQIVLDFMEAKNLTIMDLLYPDAQDNLSEIARQTFKDIYGAEFAKWVENRFIEGKPLLKYAQEHGLKLDNE